MVIGFYANCGNRDGDQTRDGACLSDFSVGIRPRRLFAHDRFRNQRYLDSRPWKTRSITSRLPS
jgi:hypothetical protein